MRRVAACVTVLALASCGGRIDGAEGSSAATRPAPAEAAPPPEEPTRPAPKPFDPLPPAAPAPTIAELDATCAKVDRDAKATPVASGEALGKATLGSWYACGGAGVTASLFGVPAPADPAGLYLLGPGSAYWLEARAGLVAPVLCLECTMHVTFPDATTIALERASPVTIELLSPTVARAFSAADPSDVKLLVRLP